MICRINETFVPKLGYMDAIHGVTARLVTMGGSAWFVRKATEIAERKARVRELCLEKGSAAYWSRAVPAGFLVDKKHKVACCRQAKVGGKTTLAHSHRWGRPLSSVSRVSFTKCAEVPVWIRRGWGSCKINIFGIPGSITSSFTDMFVCLPLFLPGWDNHSAETLSHPVRCSRGPKAEVAGRPFPLASSHSAHVQVRCQQFHHHQRIPRAPGGHVHIFVCETSI